MLKYIFSVLLIAAVWAVVLLLAFPMWIAIVATVVIVLVLLTVILVKVIRAKRAAKEIEKALKAQADAQAASARPDMRAEVDAMHNEFLKAVSALKSSKLSGGKRGAEALYALPWYMIIGPPGAGKSTALRNSGLRFPYAAGAVQGVGGTRNCQWWMTNEAVILDTAGRYTTEEADREEWMGFLDLLRKNRPKRPVNGVLVAIAISDLADVHADEVLGRAREIRARIDEVMAKLEMVVPVYVLFTKCDLMPGFVEIFSDIGTKERSQIWGFTVPVTTKERAAPLFDQHFQELSALVERRSMRRMADERAMEARDRIYAFPQYFEPLRENLTAFVGELMADSIYSEAPIFRGAYFTSGTQEGRPIDRIMNSMAEAFGVQPQMSFTQPQTEARSYFLGEVFSKVIFPDKNVATRSAARVRRAARVGYAVAAGLTLLAVGLAVLPVLSFMRNKDFGTETDEALVALNEHQASENVGVDPIDLDKLSPLYNVERTLDEHEADGVPFFMRMGMYQGARYSDRTEDLYVKTTREEVVQPLFEIEVKALNKFVQKYAGIADQPTPEESKEFRTRLRQYLLLTGPYDKDVEPGMDETQSKWLGETIGQMWADRLEKMKLTGDVNLMKRIGLAYVDNLSEHPDELLFERNPKLVKAVRRILKRTDRTEALLAELLSEVEADDVNLRRLTNSKVALKNDARIVKGAYTRAAWEDEIRDRLETALDSLLGEEWVLGRTEKEASESRGKQLIQLKSLYFENYIKQWKGFLSAVYVDAPRDLLASKKVFEDLTHGATPPIKSLCQWVHWHTQLEEAPDPDAEKAEAAGGILDAGAKALQRKGGKAGRIAGAANRARNRRRGKDGKKRNPLIKTSYDVSDAFEGFVAFGYVEPPPVREDAPPPPVSEVPLDTYQADLRSVRDALQMKLENDDAESTKKLAEAVQQGKSSVDGLINESDLKGWESTWKKLLPPPFERLGLVVASQVKGAKSKQYCVEVYDPMRAFLAQYPFEKEAREVKLKKFAEFFKPDTGKLWAFYKLGLAGMFPRKHGAFEVSRRRGVKPNPRIVKFLNRVDDLSTVMFPTGSDDLLVEFSVQIQNNPESANTSIKIDGLSRDHINGPLIFESLQWPGEGDPGGWLKTRSRVVRGEVAKPGPWGFFKLLEEGTPLGSTAGDVFSVKWDLKDQNAGVVQVKFRPAEEDTPFFGTRRRSVGFLKVFRHPNLQPPSQLYIGGKSCAGAQ